MRSAAIRVAELYRIIPHFRCSESNQKDVENSLVTGVGVVSRGRAHPLDAMNFSLLCLWSAALDVFLPRFTAQEAAALAMVAASILVFRTFRERYLLVWVLGWLAFFVSEWSMRGTAFSWSPEQALAVSQGSFILAVCLFAAAICVYTHASKALMPLSVIAVVLVGYAVARVLLWPDVVMARVPLEVAYRLIAIGGAIQLMRSRWGRWEIGPWLLSSCLLFLHLDWTPLTGGI